MIILNHTEWLKENQAILVNVYILDSDVAFGILT